LHIAPRAAFSHELVLHCSDIQLSGARGTAHLLAYILAGLSEKWRLVPKLRTISW
jgi:hypothetical protein